MFVVIAPVSDHHDSKVCVGGFDIQLFRFWTLWCALHSSCFDFPLLNCSISRLYTMVVGRVEVSKCRKFITWEVSTETFQNVEALGKFE